MKKLLSFLVTACMVVTLAPAAAFAGTQVPQDDPAIVTSEDGSSAGDQGTVEETASQETVNAEAADENEFVGTEAETGMDPSYDEPSMAVQEADPGVWREDTDAQGNKIYTYVGADGQPLYRNQLRDFGLNVYSFDENGYMVVGWQDIGTSRYFFDNTTPGMPGTQGVSYGVMKKGWYQDASGNKYYFNPTTGKMKTGWLNDNGSKYYFNPNQGASYGQMKHGCWLKLNDNKYYLNDNGKMATGKKKIGDSTYYLDPSSGKAALNKLVTINGSKYYFTSSGKMKVNGWATVSGSKYYLGSNGKALTNVRKKVGNYYYYFDSNSKMRTGAIKISGSLYYFYSSGKAVAKKGWFKGSDGKSRYSLGTSGKIATGKKQIGGYWYQFSTSSGICLKNLGDSTDQQAQSKTSGTNYLIVVLKSSHTVRVYRGNGKKNNWSRIYTFTCATGGSKTPSGTYRITSKPGRHDYTSGGKKLHYNYLSHFGSGYMGLSGLVYNEDGTLADGRLGGNYSGGNVRLSDGNASWVYTNCDIGTTVWLK